MQCSSSEKTSARVEIRSIPAKASQVVGLPARRLFSDTKCAAFARNLCNVLLVVQHSVQVHGERSTTTASTRPSLEIRSIRNLNEGLSVIQLKFEGLTRNVLIMWFSLWGIDSNVRSMQRNHLHPSNSPHRWECRVTYDENILLYEHPMTITTGTRQTYVSGRRKGKDLANRVLLGCASAHTRRVVIMWLTTCTYSAMLKDRDYNVTAHIFLILSVTLTQNTRGGSAKVCEVYCGYSRRRVRGVL